MSYYNVTIITPYMNITGLYIYIYRRFFLKKKSGYHYSHVILIIDTYYDMIR